MRIKMLLTSMLFLSYNVMSFASGTNDELGIGVAFKPLISFFTLLLIKLMPLSFLCLVAVSVILKRNDSNEKKESKGISNKKRRKLLEFGNLRLWSVISNVRSMIYYMRADTKKQ